MAKNFRLECSLPENTLTHEQNINFHKALSMGESYAKKSVKPQACLLCNSTSKQFCNSHSIPARCLRAIAVNGDVKNFNGLVKIPAVDDDKGVKEAGTFKLICRECDEAIFKDYESFEKYPAKNPPDKLLHEIALKNYLKSYHKKAIESKAFPKILENLNIPKPALLESILNTGNRDKQDSNKSIYEVKKLLKSNTNGYYRIIEYRKLSYTYPLAFQGSITLATGFDGEIINNIFNNDKKYDLQDMHLCIFPEKEYSFILVFYKKHFQRYSKFAKHYTKLDSDERLQLLLFIILKYSEDFFYSADIQAIESNPLIHEVVATTTMMICNYEDEEDAKIKECIKEYDLNNYKKLSNTLLQDFKMKKND